MEKFIDLSRIIEDNMPVYPGDIQPTLTHTECLKNNGYNNFRLSTGMHSGTHIDSPMHMMNSDKYIKDLDLETFIGNGCLIDVRNESVIHMKEVYEKRIKDKSIVLLYTGFDQYYGTPKYYHEHPIVESNFCEFLIRKEIKVLGIDTPTPDKYPYISHKMLFENNICIIENLTNLDQLIDIDTFEIMAFPLKIKADSSMVRAVARVGGLKC